MILLPIFFLVSPLHSCIELAFAYTACSSPPFVSCLTEGGVFDLSCNNTGHFKFCDQIPVSFKFSVSLCNLVLEAHIGLRFVEVLTMEAAVSAARWVLGKALAPVTDGLLEAWAASAGLGDNIDALKMELLFAQAMLDNARGRELHSPALAQMLHKLRQLAHDADDVLDELDYFRIQDALDGTYHAADTPADGCAKSLALNTLYTARALAGKLKLTSGSRDSANHGDPDDQEDDDAKRGRLSGVPCSCGGRAVTSSPPSPTNNGDQKASGKCLPKFAYRARNAACAVGKHLPCYSSPCAHDDAHSSMSEKGSNEPGNGWRSIFSACPSRPQKINDAAKLPKLKFDRVEISIKMRAIIEQLKPICAKVSTILNLEPLGSSCTTAKDIAMNRPITSSEIIEPKLYGRDSQKKRIVDAIADGEYAANKFTVLPIVGAGGIGKTTFTQHVYQEVNNNFQVSVWTCVSLNFNANNLLQDIVDKIPEVNGESKNDSVEERIGQRIKSKRFLLVLDDMWTYHEDEWKKLLAPFRKGEEKGNMVMVTTRIPEVAKMVKTVDCWLELERLEAEDFLRFFEACVFGEEQSFKDHDALLGVGEQILDKLKGFPLAAKTVGRLLRNQLNLDHWRRVLDSKEWELQTSDNDIMPALKLSYDYLPFHLQQCFSYCALFPEDYEFDSKELIHLWIGLDILHSHEKNKKVGEVGESYLHELVSYGFFKESKTRSGSPCYVIHDLLHDLGVKVSSDECLSIYGSNMGSIQIPPSVRHISIVIEDTILEDRIRFEECKTGLSALDKRLNAENLHTLMLFGNYHVSFAKEFRDLFREARRLRVVFLSEALSSYDVDNLLCNFSKLVHLRYIRIACRPYLFPVRLPSSTARLYHLRILDVSGCNIDSRFLREMRNLTKLQHFLTLDDSILSGIFEVGKLKLLQELRRFEVSKENSGFELKELGQLQELHGSLSIYNLEKVQAKEEAEQAKVIQKFHLKQLTLSWDSEQSDGSKNPKREELVLESLKPHSNLQELCIRGHGGAKCPTWLGTNLNVQNLESLCLYDIGWKNLPPIEGLWMVSGHAENCHGQSFKNLKRLELVKIPTLEKWVGNDPCKVFSHLEELVIRDCSVLMELPFSRSTCEHRDKEVNLNWFPMLRKLVIINCPNLLSLPRLPWTRAPCSLNIGNSDASKCFESLFYRKDESECSLKVDGLDGAWLKVLDFDNLTELKSLEAQRCPPLPPDHLQMLSSLKTLEIRDPNSGLWPFEGESHAGHQFPVENLVITECGASGKEFTQLLSHFPKLSTLRISNCQKITRAGVMGKQATRMIASTRIKSGPSPSASAKMEGVQIGQNQLIHARGDREIAVETEDEEVLLLPPNLQSLRMYKCPNLILINLPSDLHSLQSLEIEVCPEFLSSYSSSSTSCFPFASSLQFLELRSLEGMEAAAVPLSNLVSLTTLWIIGCGDLRSEGLGTLLTQGQLTELGVSDSPRFLVDCSKPSRTREEDPLPWSSKLQKLGSDDIAGVLTDSFCSLVSSSLATLSLAFNYDVERFTMEQVEALLLLTSLHDLEFEWCGKMQYLPAGLHKLDKLKALSIVDCKALRSLPKDGLPSSLQHLSIGYCPAIRSLPKVDTLASSLLSLTVNARNSKELIRQCRKLKGTIPRVYT
ncbi:hypothetical protein SEVIR_7G048300v4 [Setaria viridis]|uniref:putative disease resistance protein At3g14460 n=1 Tax=Setaria viridis TaxID=4556 RepID=UPI003B3AF0A3